ncbi:MAG TPA: TIR-like protein FxsC [Streptosporangiaceae bacterium]|nr:TIR-like protein FxsC [Streptosporangiaceae bacterium]
MSELPSGRASAPYFFLSYAHTPTKDRDDPDRWVHQLYNDLCKDIIAISTIPPELVGFMDRDMQPGTDWSRRLCDALASCRVFVPLYSPRYFESEACGKEWYVFARRALDHRAEHGHQVEAIVPALWAAVRPSQLPEAARMIQFDHQTFGRRYSKDGFYGIMKLGRYRPEYRQAVWRLACRIVEVAEQAPLAPVAPVDDFDSLPKSFGSAGGGNESRQLRITVAASSTRTLPDGRDPSYYGATAREWRPFQPSHSQPLAEYAAELTTMMGFKTTINTIAEELGEQSASDLAPALGLFLLDAWNTLPAKERERIREYDQQAKPWVSVMVPWNELDAQTLEAEKELQALLRTSVSRIIRRMPPKCRIAVAGIPNLTAFGDILPRLIYHAEKMYLRNSPTRAPAGPPVQRPKLTGPYIENSSYDEQS